MKIGIVPAAGVGSRWGGYPKFLLPYGERKWMLDRTIRSFPECKCVVVYSPITFDPIIQHLIRTDMVENVEMVENVHMELDFYGSMIAGMQEEADYYYFAMPDTFFPAKSFALMPPYGISLGVHHTVIPERYGVLRDGKVVNKIEGEPGMAWGILGWDKKVRDLWLSSSVDNYTDAINLAIETFPSKQIEMDFYFDFASWNDYKYFVEAAT